MPEEVDPNVPATSAGNGPSALYIDAFAVFLHEQGYAALTIRGYVRAANRFDRWLLFNKIVLIDIDEPTVERFVSGLGRYQPPSRRYAKVPDAACAVRRFAEYLWRNGVAHRNAPMPAMTKLDVWLQSYDRHLLRVGGLSAGTRSDYVRYARKFVLFRFGEAERDWGALRADDLTEFVRAEAARLGPAGCRRPATGVRALLRYLEINGLVPHGLAGAVPLMRRGKNTAIPHHLTHKQIGQVLDACDASSAVGRRDKAVVSILAGLGLRAGEVAGLRLDDFDWRNSSVVIRAGKTARERCLPIPHEVGTAIVTYLQHGRQSVPERAVFLRVRPPRGPLTGRGVTEIARAALARAELYSERSGAHVFRHSMATQLVRRGASFKDIADILGHGRIETTTIYAKLDVDTLARIALPWPGGES